jgi:4-aminobutyrate aminotransferase-like enzyme
MSGRISSGELWSGYGSAGTQVPRIVGGEGVYFVLEDGRRVIDASNTGGPLGHRHPDIVAAMKRALEAPVVNEAWTWVDREVAIEELAAIAFEDDADWFGGLRFCLSGSEANDLALSLAQALTGRTALAARERAYHGASGLAREVTLQPHWHGGVAWRDGEISAVPRAGGPIEIPGPVGERIGPVVPDAAADVSRLQGVDGLLSEAAAVIVDYTQGGTYHSAAYQDELASAASSAGALWVADEVVTGFGRTGRWFEFQGGSSRPDLVTLGKAFGAGAAPAGAVVFSRQLAERLAGSSWQTGGTFRTHPATIAAVRAHLAVLQRDGLVERARAADSLLEGALTEVARRHPSVSRIDGRSLHWTVELHGPGWRAWRGDALHITVADRVRQVALDTGALIGTSGEQTSLFIAPALIIEDADLLRIVDALDAGLREADEEFARTG